MVSDFKKQLRAAIAEKGFPHNWVQRMQTLLYNWMRGDSEPTSRYWPMLNRVYGILGEELLAYRRVCAEIRELRNKGKTYKEISAVYGINYDMTGKIIKRESYSIRLSTARRLIAYYERKA